MMYAMLCYDNEAAVGAWTREQDDACMARIAAVCGRFAAEGRMGPSARLMPTTAATTLRKSTGEVLDGPFAETREQLLGFFMVECETLEAAIAAARDLSAAMAGTGSFELRPVAYRPPDPRVP